MFLCTYSVNISYSLTEEDYITEAGNGGKILDKTTKSRDSHTEWGLVPWKALQICEYNVVVIFAYFLKKVLLTDSTVCFCIRIHFGL